MGVIDSFTKFIPETKKEPKDETSKEVMTKSESKKEKHFIRTLGNVRTTAEAQRIYNPSLPPTNPKGPTAAQMEAGTSSAMDIQGNWGTPIRAEG